MPLELRLSSIAVVALFAAVAVRGNPRSRRVAFGLAACLAAVAGGLAIGLVGGLGPGAHPAIPSRVPPSSPATGLTGALQSRARAAFGRGPGGDLEALMVGMAMGDDSALSASTRDQFRRSSMSHVTAASGQNIALLLALVLPLLMAVGVGFRARLIAAAGLVCVYVPFCGGQAPIQRAAVMGIAGLAGTWAGVRVRPSVAPVLLAAVITVLVDPSAPWKLGWQLSFAAVIGMVALGGPIALRFQRLGMSQLLAEPLALTIAATAATTPLIAHAAGRVSITAIPANLLSAPAVAIAMAAGLAACLIAQVSVAAATLPVWAGSIPAAAVLEIARIAGSPDWASKQWRPSVLFTAGLLTVIAGAAVWLRLERDRYKLSVFVGPALVLGTIAVFWLHRGDPSQQTGPRIVFIAVGQGDAELVADGDTGILVDTGPPGTPIAAELRKLGIKHLAALLITHGQADHAGGLTDLLAGFRPDLVLDGSRTAPGGESARVAAALARAGVHSVEPAPGQRIEAGSASIELLSPEHAVDAGTDPNAASAVAIAHAGTVSALLTADAESSTLEALALGHVDVFKLPHHGSADPGIGAILERVTPLISVVEVGRNGYGHPTRQALAQAAKWGGVLRTDLNGNVSVKPATAGGIQVNPER